MSRIRSARTGLSDMARTAQEGEHKRVATLKVSTEARSLRHQQLERQRKQEEDSNSSDYSHYKDQNGVQAASSRYSSHQSSIELSHTPNGSLTNDLSELKRMLAQLNEKYKEVLVTNAQLDCEKQLLTYSVDLLKDKLEDTVESNLYNQKCAADRKRDLAYQRMQLSELNRQLEIAQHQIAIRDELITERGFVLVNAEGGVSDNSPFNGNIDRPGIGTDNATSSDSVANQSRQTTKQTAIPNSSTSASSSSYTILSKSNADELKLIEGVDIDSKLSTLLAERQKNKERIQTLQLHLAEERERVEVVQKLDVRSKGGDPENLRQMIQASRSQAQDYKFRLEQANQKIVGLEGDIVRLEGQVKRCKVIAENAEQQEDQLKQERRKLQRELREALSKIDDLKSENNTFQRKIDKLSRGPPDTTLGTNLRSYRGSSQAR